MLNNNTKYLKATIMKKTYIQPTAMAIAFSSENDVAKSTMLVGSNVTQHDNWSNPRIWDDNEWEEEEE